MIEGTIRVLVVDDQRLVAEAFAERLAGEPDLDLVGVADDDESAMLAIGEHLPHVVLLDYMMPKAEGPEVAAAITRRWPGVQVVMVTGRTDEDARRRSVEAGCVGFVSKDATTEELLTAVRTAAVGADVPASALAPAGGPDALVTARELEVLRMLAAGRSTRDISTALFISYATTRNHIQHILHKLGAHSRLQAVAMATRRGLLDHKDVRDHPSAGRTWRRSDDGPTGEVVGTGP